ncbi:MAG: hypothetical protein AAGD11_04870 [Planctomycetota bacterium]
MLDTLLENPLPILAVGAILATFCGIIFLAKRNLPSLVGLAAVILFTSLFIVTEQLIVTPREQVEVSIDQILDAIQANDVDAVLALVDPSATDVRGQVEALMPMVDVDDTGATAIQIDCEGRDPTEATSQFKGRVLGIHTQSGMAVRYFDQVELNWIRSDGQWLLSDFTAYWKGKPLNAVSSLRGSQPAAVTR